MGVRLGPSARKHRLPWLDSHSRPGNGSAGSSAPPWGTQRGRALPRYYHDHDFVEYLRDPLHQGGREER